MIFFDRIRRQFITGLSILIPAVLTFYIIYFLFKDLLGEHATHSMAIFGAALIAVIVFSPDGIVGAVQRLLKGGRVHGGRRPAGGH